MPCIVLIQSSLNPQSKTAILVATTAKILKNKLPPLETEILDLGDLTLQFCDGRKLQQYNYDNSTHMKFWPKLMDILLECQYIVHQ